MVLLSLSIMSAEV